MRESHHRLALVTVTTLVVTAVAPAGAAESATAESIDVTLAADGSATVTVRSTDDLRGDAEAAAFEELRTDDAAREELRTSFRDRMALVA